LWERQSQGRVEGVRWSIYWLVGPETGPPSAAKTVGRPDGVRSGRAWQGCHKGLRGLGAGTDRLRTTATGLASLPGQARGPARACVACSGCECLGDTASTGPVLHRAIPSLSRIHTLAPLSALLRFSAQSAALVLLRLSRLPTDLLRTETGPLGKKPR
jgi:hypothetical protein